MQILTKFKVIFDVFTVCIYFIQQQNCKLYYIYLMIISGNWSEIGHCSCDSAKFKAPADFTHHVILFLTLSLRSYNTKPCCVGSLGNSPYRNSVNIVFLF